MMIEPVDGRPEYPLPFMGPKLYLIVYSPIVGPFSGQARCQVPIFARFFLETSSASIVHGIMNIIFPQKIVQYHVSYCELTPYSK